MHRWPTIKEASKQTGYNARYLQRLIREGKVRGEKAGRMYFVDPDSLARYIEQVKTHPAGGPRTKQSD